MSTKIKIKLYLLLILQPLDGILTYMGVLRSSSILVEGNPLLRYLMEELSADVALVTAKLTACFFIGILLIVLNKRTEFHKLFNILLNICLLFYIFAVVSWIYILTFGELS